MSRNPAPRPAGRPARITPMWLAHHYPEDYDRCVRIGRSHVCRRCLVLYPLAFAVLALTRDWAPAGVVDVVLVAGLPLPAVIELATEHLAGLRFSPRRQVAVTVPLAVGLGRGFARYLADQTDLLFWAVVVAYTAAAGTAVWVGRTRGRARGSAGRGSV